MKCVQDKTTRTILLNSLSRDEYQMCTITQEYYKINASEEKNKIFFFLN